jgi:hypothetical protein
MRRTAAFFLLLLFAGAGICQQQDIHRALVQRDQQSAEFAAQLRSSQESRRLETLHASQQRDAMIPLSADSALAQQLFPYQRERMSEERELRLAPPVIRQNAPDPARAPRALPGGPRPGVDPIAPQ